MNRKDLYQSFNNIDDDILERSEKNVKKNGFAWVKWGVVAACLCILFVSAYMVQDLWKKTEHLSEPGITDTIVLSPDGTNQQEDESVEQAPVDVVDEQLNPGQLIFNDAASFLSASRKYIPGYFTEQLDDKDILAIKPDRQFPDMCFSGVAGYDGEGTLLEIFLRIEAPILDDVVHVTFNNGSPSSCYEPLEEPIISTYNGMDYTIYQWTPDGSNYTLGAYAEIDSWSMQIAYTATAETLEKAKTDFATIILCMSDYADGKPDFSSIVAENIPEYYDKQLNLNAACDDPDFGPFMVQELPEGFTEESIRRYKDQNNDYLSGLWTRGLANLSWKISAYDEDDAARCTSVAQTENYNLALYPIPRAESVPEELREIVDNPIFDATELTLEAVYMRAYKVEDAGDIDGWRMVFSVKYGDVIVEIRTKGVEPEWVYEQLQMISKYSE